jgi:putative ATP-binding cassette transporter
MAIFGLSFGVGQLLFFSIIGLLIFGLPQWNLIDTKILSAYVLVCIYLLDPLQRVLEMLPGLSRGSVALDKLRMLGLSLADRAEPMAKRVESSSSFDRLELIGVTYTYRNHQEESFTLGPIDFAFSPGELIFIVGGNGSGKSTLVKAIAGLYIPETGEIRLDGQIVTDRDRESYRQLFSTVFADFYLFERFLGLQSPELTIQVQKYLQQLQLERKVHLQGDRLSTIELSQGQRKRLALLTAYLEDRPIYIFDEWAADQDPFFREIFYKQLLPELKNRGKTVLAISHDDRYFHLSDRILKLDYGKLV